MDTPLICGTCHFLDLKTQKRGYNDPAKIGYCYGNPPVLPGNFRVQVSVKDKACHLYKPKAK